MAYVAAIAFRLLELAARDRWGMRHEARIGSRFMLFDN
jgi:hypothetical protein